MSNLEPGQARIVHPDLDPDGVVVPAESVPHHERAGWQFIEGDRDTWPKELQKYGGQREVRIYHPQLDRTVGVPESAVPFHREKGWVPADERDAEQLEESTVDDLKDEARKRGLKVSGTKDELVERIQAYDAQQQTEAGDAPAPSDEEEGQ
jgi:SAP domain